MPQKVIYEKGQFLKNKTVYTHISPHLLHGFCNNDTDGTAHLCHTRISDFLTHKLYVGE